MLILSRGEDPSFRPAWRKRIVSTTTAMARGPALKNGYISPRLPGLNAGA
jgi:hypothetical protein